MKKSLAGLLAVPLGASMVLAGCGGDTKPLASSPTSTSSSSTSTAATSTTSASPTTAVAPADPDIPAAARAHTNAGAEAFVRYFYSQLNVALTMPQAGLVSQLSTSTCKTCSAFERSAVDLESKHQHYRGNAFAVRTVGSIGESEILVVGEQPPGAVVDVSGAVVKSRAQAQKAKFIVTVSWSSGRWRINEIRVLQ